MDNDKTSSKLMTPLFYDSSFNRKGRKMRAVFEREISNGTVTYRLWRSAGKPDLDYPRAENDKYILHVELNGYLIPLGMTDFHLIGQCGFKAAVKKLYGSDEKREQHFDGLRSSGGGEAVLAALELERIEVEQCGTDAARQAEYIQKHLNGHVNAYLTSKETGGDTFPDFRGAAVMNELDICVELSDIYRVLRREKELARAAQEAEKERAFCEERNKEAEQLVAKAIQTIRSGGILKNETVTFYRSRYDSSAYSIVNYLMRLYQVDVPLRTQGWINERLSSATIKDGKCEHLMYLRSKRGRGSNRFFQCMNDLIQAIKEQAPDQREGAA